MVPAVMAHRHSHHPAAHRAVMIGIVMIVGKGNGTCGQRRNKYPSNQQFHDCSAPSGASSPR